MNEISTTDKKKKVFLQSFHQITALETALDVLKELDPQLSFASILANLGSISPNDSKGLTRKEESVEVKFQKLLGEAVKSGTFYNHEIGLVGVGGFLESILLSPVGQKVIGSLSGGPYGVLRGMEVSDTKALFNLKELSAGSYLLIIRGDQQLIGKVQHVLA